MTKQLSARDELDQFIGNLTSDEAIVFKEIDFSKIPIDAFALGHILDSLPEDIQEKHGAKITTLKKLNGLISLSEPTQSNLSSATTTEADRRKFLVERVMRKLTLKTLRDTDEILYYQDGVYKSGAETRILEEIQKLAGYELTNHMRNEVLQTIRARSYVDRNEFDKECEWIHLGNGWYNLSTKEFVGHSPERLSFLKIPWDYDPSATCPEHLAFFSQVFEEEDLEPAQKMYGYLLLSDNRYKKAFGLVGPKDSGKSVTLSDIESFTGSASHVGLHDMAAYNHNVATMTKSIVNTASELPKYRLKDVSLFKAITGNDERTFREIYGKPFNSKVRAKFVMASNELPNFDDMDQTFIDRWVIFRFSNVFKRGEDMDVNVLTKLITPSEMSGLINFALEGLAKLIESGYFKEQDYQELKATWDQVNSKIGDYVKEHCELQETASIPADELFEDYAKQGGELSKAMFGREIKKLGIKHVRKRIVGKLRWVYEGITSKNASVPCVLGNFDKPLLYGEPMDQNNPEFHRTPRTTDIFYCPKGCNKAFETSPQVEEHLKNCHTAEAIA